MEVRNYLNSTFHKWYAVNISPLNRWEKHERILLTQVAIKHGNK